MAEYTKTINIRSFDLGVNTTFFLTFDEEIPGTGMYTKVFPVVWKVTEFPKAGGYDFKAIFKSQLGFTRAEIKNGVVLPASTYIPIKVKQQTALTKNLKKHVYSFSEPTVGTKDHIEAKNNTDDKEIFGVGIFEREVKYPPTTLLVFENVNSKSLVRTKPPILLRGYVVSDIEENEVLRKKVTTPVLFSEDITKLDDVTFWRITYNKSLKKYKIERDVQKYT